jgi:hypothetical protein
MLGNEKDMDEEKVVSATIPGDFKGENGDYRFTAQQGVPAGLVGTPSKVQQGSKLTPMSCSGRLRARSPGVKEGRTQV